MLELYVDEITTCLKKKCYFSALSLSLMLPDMCGMAEFPNKQVAGRYISWYDTYIGDYLKKERENEEEPYLSGEIVYNLRNCFFHEGQPNINAGKVKEEINKFDRFVLLVGYENIIYSYISTINVMEAWYRIICVDISYLCNLICHASLFYYSTNREKFSYNFRVLSMKSSSEKIPEEVKIDYSPISNTLNKKLEAAGNEFHHIPPEVIEDIINKSLTYVKNENLSK